MKPGPVSPQEQRHGATDTPALSPFYVNRALGVTAREGQNGGIAWAKVPGFLRSLGRGATKGLPDGDRRLPGLLLG